MSDRVEVIAGHGTVVRYGEVTVWAGPASSPALVSFLLESARNVGAAHDGGRQMIEHIAGILAARDPEPGVPFAAIGPAPGGLAAVLHGPVQLWDGTRWLAPTPAPGWLQAVVDPHTALSVGPAGSPSPRLDHASRYDLVAGVVPGAGFLLVRERNQAGGTGWAAPAGASSTKPSAAGIPTPAGGPAAGFDAGGGEASRGGTGAPLPAGPLTVAGVPAQTGAGAPGTLVTFIGRPGTRIGPLPPAGAPLGGSGPECEVRTCPSGHPNHPAMLSCARCGAPLGDAPSQRAPRPALGLLIGADGAAYRVAGDLVIGSAPASDDAVRFGQAQPLRLWAPQGALAPAHAQLRTEGWQLSVIDRGSELGTYVAEPGGADWTRITPMRAVPLRAGAHLSLGQQVLTWVSPWPS